jgi:transposase InsO family protein
MTIHKSTRLAPIQRKEIAARYFQGNARIATLAREYRVSRNTIYIVVNRARVKDFSVHRSVNERYRCLEYGLKRLAKVEAALEKKLQAKAFRYNKSYPGEMMHSDNTPLPMLEGEKKADKPETLYVAIDDFSRELYAAILPDRTQYSSASFMKQVLEECPYTIQIWYTDNGTEYKGNPKEHEFMKLCGEHGVKQSFTRPKTPRTNGKAERVIKTIQEMWLAKTKFKNRAHRKQELIRFVNYYNTVKPHKGIGNRTPLEQLINYFYPKEL